MSETLTFHFEGALADSHRMNFYEAARFQYAAARLMVKLDQFRQHGRFVRKITDRSNVSIDLLSQTEGSYNMNVDDPGQVKTEDHFITISLADLIAFGSERLIEKIDENSLEDVSLPQIIQADEQKDVSPIAALDELIKLSTSDKDVTGTLPMHVQDLIKRQVSETYREQRLAEQQRAISKIDSVRGQRLIAMSAPLVSEMATALRRSAKTLEVTSTSAEQVRSVLFLNREMARSIETAVVDEDITPILGDISQFNKDNGWGKLKIENGTKTVGFSIPSDIYLL